MFDAPLKSGRDVLRPVAEIVRPPRRVSPVESCENKLRNDRDTWHVATTPYLAEPLNELASRVYQGIVFGGPARTGKTFGLALGSINYVVTVSPADILAIYMSQDTARDFSRLEVDRAIQHTPELAARLSPRARDDNTYDKFFRSGIALKIGWPASTQLRGKTIKYVLLMDYDGGNSIDVDGRGSLWGQAFKRIQTYLSRGKCIAESSPGVEYADADWQPSTPHEVPPAKGIAEIYNSGTRARWYWRCLHCGEHFESKPGIDVFNVPPFEEIAETVLASDLMMLAESFARVPCPHCGGLHEPSDKAALNRVHSDGDRILGATWLHEGEQLVDGRLEGERLRRNIASYWLGGAAAAYQDWVSLMYRYLAGVQKFVTTGDETGLKESSHDDQAWPYLPRSVGKRRSAEGLKARRETWPQGRIPADVRFLTAAVDVQANRFVVHVMGWGVDLESWLVDRFSITASDRPEADKFAAVDPAAYVEDWHPLLEQVIEREYQFEGADVRLRPRLVFCDSGGKEGVTDKAYEFWRQIKRQGLGTRFMLVKGVGNLNAPRVQQTYPDARARKDRVAGRGDVPVWLLNVNVLKDGVDGDLKRDQVGPKFVHIPDWIDDAYFDEIRAETRGAKGWERKGNKPNEAFDLHTYNRAACIVLRAEAINWGRPPKWAQSLDDRIDAEREAREADKQPPKKRRSRRGNWTTQW